MKVTMQMYAYLPRHCKTAMEDLDEPEADRNLVLMHNKDELWKEMGYTYVGCAEVVIDVECTPEGTKA